MNLSKIVLVPVLLAVVVGGCEGEITTIPEPTVVVPPPAVMYTCEGADWTGTFDFVPHSDSLTINGETYRSDDGHWVYTHVPGDCSALLPLKTSVIVTSGSVEARPLPPPPPLTGSSTVSDIETTGAASPTSNGLATCSLTLVVTVRAALHYGNGDVIECGRIDSYSLTVGAKLAS
jgi:hypothetical protein